MPRQAESFRPLSPRGRGRGPAEGREGEGAGDEAVAPLALPSLPRWAPPSPARGEGLAVAERARSRLMRHAQISVDHALVGAYGVGHAVGDLAAVVEDDDAVGDIHHHAHIVLDERDRRAELVVDVEDE